MSYREVRDWKNGFVGHDSVNRVQRPSAPGRVSSGSHDFRRRVFWFRPAMSSIAELLSQAEKCASSNPKQAEDLYKKILHNTSGKSSLHLGDRFTKSKTASTAKEPPRDEEQAQNLRDQEIALVRLGELYRNQK